VSGVCAPEKKRHLNDFNREGENFSSCGLNPRNQKRPGKIFQIKKNLNWLRLDSGKKMRGSVHLSIPDGRKKMMYRTITGDC